MSACGSSPPAPTATEEQVEEEHEEEAEHMDDEDEDPMEMEEHEDDGHTVPEEAAAMLIPITASDESVAIGRELFATNCALCHGETGEGDGPAASGLAKPPADLNEDHVQSLTDGALFYIISQGVPDSPMPAWENVLSEDERWHLVNFLRTFSE